MELEGSLSCSQVGKMTLRCFLLWFCSVNEHGEIQEYADIAILYDLFPSEEQRNTKCYGALWFSCATASSTEKYTTYKISRAITSFIDKCQTPHVATRYKNSYFRIVLHCNTNSCDVTNLYPSGYASYMQTSSPTARKEMTFKFKKIDKHITKMRSLLSRYVHS
jgi:hypothetical protein